MARIESFLSARLFLTPQRVGDRIYFISNLSGHLSLYVMDYGGSVPEPLLPPEIALQNPHLINGESFFVFPELDKIIVNIDKDGDEKYQPMEIPLEGGYPKPAFGDQLKDFQVFMGGFYIDNKVAYLYAASHKEARNILFQANFETGTLNNLYQSMYGGYPTGYSADHSKVAISEGYTMGDTVLYLWDKNTLQTKRLIGVPLEKREPGQDVPLNNIHSVQFVEDDQAIIFNTTLIEDKGSLGYLKLDDSGEVEEVEIRGLQHKGEGEMGALEHLTGNRYSLAYNIDGVDWVYEGTYDESLQVFELENVLVGQGELTNGVLEHISYEKATDSFAVSHSTATSPTQIYTIENPDRSKVVRHTRERILSISDDQLSPGEDASFTSFDGLRVSARLYMPADVLGYEGPRPVVYYVHGGPQGQERPDFAWFSMPLIQFLTMNGFAVFVPNVRGSTGYGLEYTKRVDRDWGGADRLDHVHAMTEILPKDDRLDVSRAGVVGRSYGGYMTLTLAGRHTELWKAAVDMFGPFDLITFSERIPETWKPYFAISLGDPNKPEERKFLIERSPNTYLDQIECPLMVIQGKNDPRVVEQESRDLVEHLQSIGKEVDYLVFEDEGHDVLKYKNRVKVYNTITDYFIQHLEP